MLNLNSFFKDSDNKSLSKIILSILAISLLRSFLENFSNTGQSGNFFSFQNIFLHFPIYYISLFLSFALILYFFTRKPLLQILNFESKVFIFVLIAPIIDLLSTNGTGATIAYITTEPTNLIGTYFKLLNPFGYMGVTQGVHASAYLIIISLSIYIYKSNKSLIKSFIFIFLGYSLLYLYAISPSLIALPMTLSSNSSALDAYALTLNASWLKTILENTSLFLNFIQGLDNSLFETTWVMPITQLLFVLTFFQIIWATSLFNNKLFTILKKEIRFERILTWLAISAIGMALSNELHGPIRLFNTINLITLTTFFIIIILNIWLAATINDEEDIEIDKVSNATRPLASGSITLEQWKNIQFLLLILIIFGLATLGSKVAFLIFLSQATYYLYSSKPFRLKSHFLSSSLLTGLAAVAIMMSGFFLVSENQRLDAFPIKIIMLIWISFALLFNLKDIKDYDGDKKSNIRTLPVVFGLKRSKLIIGILSSAIFVTVPMIFKMYTAMPFSILSALFIFYLLNKNPYRDNHVFYMIAIYIVSLLLLSL